MFCTKISVPIINLFSTHWSFTLEPHMYPSQNFNVFTSQSFNVCTSQNFNVFTSQSSNVCTSQSLNVFTSQSMSVMSVLCYVHCSWCVSLNRAASLWTIHDPMRNLGGMVHENLLKASSSLSITSWELETLSFSQGNSLSQQLQLWLHFQVAAYQKGVSPTRNRKISLDNIGIYIWISNLQHIVFGSQFLGKSSEIALIL